MPSELYEENGILLYLVLHPLWNNFLNADASIIARFAQRTHVAIIACDSALPSCDHIQTFANVYNLDRTCVCKLCQHQSSNMLENFANEKNISIHYVSELLLSYTDNPHSIFKQSLAEVKNHTIGHVSACNNDRIRIRTVKKRFRLSKTNRYVKLRISYSLLYRCVDILISRLQKKGQKVIGGALTHGHRTPSNGFCKALSKYNIPWISYLNNRQEHTIFIYSDNSNIFDLSIPQNKSILIHKLAAAGQPDDKSIIKTLQKFYPRILAFSNTASQIHNQDINYTLSAQDYLFSQSVKPLPVNPSSIWVCNAANSNTKLVLIALSTESENFGSAESEEDLHQWKLISAIQEISSKEPDLIFVFRDHPYRHPDIESPFSGETDYWSCFIQDHLTCSDLPRVLWISAGDELSTYQLGSIADVAICLYTSAAVDISLMGVPVITDIDSAYAFMTKIHIDFGQEDTNDHLCKEILTKLEVATKTKPDDFAIKCNHLDIYHTLIEPESVSISPNSPDIDHVLNYLETRISLPNITWFDYSWGIRDCLISYEAKSKDAKAQIDTSSHLKTLENAIATKKNFIRTCWHMLTSHYAVSKSLQYNYQSAYKAYREHYIPNRNTVLRSTWIIQNFLKELYLPSICFYTDKDTKISITSMSEKIIDEYHRNLTILIDLSKLGVSTGCKEFQLQCINTYQFFLSFNASEILLIKSEYIICSGKSLLSIIFEIPGKSPIKYEDIPRIFINVDNHVVKGGKEVISKFNTPVPLSGV